jgi:ABC-type maltose transport system permease subunit
MAAVGFAVIPVLIVFIIGQRWIVEAFTKSGLKG